MEEFLKLTMWEMRMPEAYGAFHIITTTILLLIAILLAYLLRKSDDKKHRIILVTTSLILIVSEVYKIAVHVTVNPYNWGFFGAFPFQLCSVPMYLCLFAGLFKNERINSWLYEFMFAYNMFGGIMAFIEPSGINHLYLVLTLHAYIWHMTLIFLGLYLYMSKRACTNKKSFYKAVVVYCIACILAQIINIIFKEQGVNCFYISPFVRSPLAVFKDIYVSAGWFANMILLMLGISIAAAILYYIGYYIRIKNKNTKTTIGKRENK